MINNWWVTRPKRKLNSVPEILAIVAQTALNQEWEGQRGTHLNFEEALEGAEIKRIGERRDQGGGGGRTYIAWLKSLGLVFNQESSGKLMLTLAGEAIMAGDSPVDVLKHQILRYQFPSSYSLSRGVNVNRRFRIRPFRFLLRLLSDSQIAYLTEEEIGFVVIFEAENESDKCYKKVVSKITTFRAAENRAAESVMEPIKEYLGEKAEKRKDPYKNLMDTANTIANWLEYTQLAKRDDYGKIRILPEMADEVNSILSTTPPFIDRPESQEYYQRKYGVDPTRNKDTRNLTETQTITDRMIVEHKVKSAFIGESLRSLITKIDAKIIDKISEQTSVDVSNVEEILRKFYPRGAVGSFMSEYFEMAFRGRDNATEFETATVELFCSVFGYEAQHVGPIGLTPDVLLLSDEDGYSAIVDNKAYSKYSINNDHRNRMVTNYIGGFESYYKGELPLAFFSYIAGGFGNRIDEQIEEIFTTTFVHGSAISVHNIISLIEHHSKSAYSHKKLRDLFSLNRQILNKDLI